MRVVATPNLGMSMVFGIFIIVHNKYITAVHVL